MASKQDDQDRNPRSGEPEVLSAYQQPRRGGYQRQGIAETAIKSFIRSIAGTLGRVIMRAIVGRR